MLTVTGFFWYLDLNDYDLITEDFVEYTDYLTSEIHRARYADVQRAETLCYPTNDGLAFRYRLVFADNARVELFDEKNIIKRMGFALKIDQILVSQGTEIIHAETRPGWFNDDKPGVHQDCQKLIDREFSPALQPVLHRLLHLD